MLGHLSSIEGYAAGGGGDEEDDDDEDDDDIDDDEEIAAENDDDLSFITSNIGPPLPLIGESAAGKRLKTYKALDKFDFNDKRHPSSASSSKNEIIPLGVGKGNSGGDEGVPLKPIVQAEDPNIPIRKPEGEAEAEA